MYPPGWFPHLYAQLDTPSLRRSRAMLDDLLRRTKDRPTSADLIALAAELDDLDHAGRLDA